MIFWQFWDGDEPFFGKIDLATDLLRAIGEAYAENQQPEVLIQQHYNQGNKENNQSDNQ